MEAEVEEEEKRKRRKKIFFFLKYEPYMDNMDVVSTSQSQYFQKLDGVGPVDNRPSTD